ncbi:MAG: YlmC/YmxH family sporulation protein [Bacillota bacterium]|jgi:YlmC/YmxH family sporulation protein
MIRISDLASLEVINLEDGRVMGLIDDLEIDLDNGRITSVVIPVPTGIWGLFSGGREHVIRWNDIIKIGEDVILVRYREGGRSIRKREK